MEIEDLKNVVGSFIDTNKIEYFDADSIKLILNNAANQQEFKISTKTALEGEAKRFKNISNSVSRAIQNNSKNDSDMFNAVIEAGQTATKSIFLVTAGASLVSLTLMGSFIEHKIKIDLSDSILLFVIGLFMAVVLAGFRYISQGFYSNSKYKTISEKNTNWGNVFRNLSVLSHIVSAILFVAGVFVFYVTISEYAKLNI